MGCSRRTSMRLCVLLRSARSIIIGISTQKQSEQFFSPRHCQHLHPNARLVFASSFSTGPPGGRGALQCHWNASATTQLGLVPVSPGGLLYQSLKSKVKLAAAKAAALRINLNVEGCGVVAPPMHAPSCAPLLLPLLMSLNLPFPLVN